MWFNKKRKLHHLVELLDGHGSTIDSWVSELPLAELRRLVLPRVIGRSIGADYATTTTTSNDSKRVYTIVENTNKPICVSVRLTEIEE